ncbi:MAG: extracellular solute-binding protein [Oscillospiraceae bacterium]|nr:extracellular solute-binding protein [Oscillospiraceae bacterium]
MKRYGLLLVLVCVLLLPACGENEIPPEAEEGVLIYAALNPVSNTVQSYIDTFNESHTDVQIEVRDYSDEGGSQRLLTELVLGRVPDIIELYQADENINRGKRLADRYEYVFADRSEEEFYMPYRQMALSGYLEDLWPYIESDPELGPDGLVEAPFKAAEVNGGLYMLFSGVSVSTLIGSRNIFGDRMGWTLDEILELYRSMPDESTILRCDTTKYEMFSQIFASMLDQYINWETGETSFDSEEFYSMVEFLRAFPDTLETNLSYYEMEREGFERIHTGRQLLEVAVLKTVTDIAYARSISFPEGVSLVGYPTTDGTSGSFFYLHGSVWGMSSTCKNKEAAWDFMRQPVAKVYPSGALRNMSAWEGSPILVNQSNYERSNRLTLTAAKQHVGYTEVGTSFGVWVPYQFPTKEDLASFKALVDNTTQIYWPNDDLSNIVWETLGPYYARDKTLEQTVQMLNNRVGLYVNEQR